MLNALVIADEWSIGEHDLIEVLHVHQLILLIVNGHDDLALVDIPGAIHAELALQHVAHESTDELGWMIIEEPVEALIARGIVIRIGNRADVRTRNRTRVDHSHAL